MPDYEDEVRDSTAERSFVEPVDIAENDVPSQDEARPAELEDPVKLARTVFVGNVPVDVKRKEIKQLFRPFGPVETVRLRGVVAANPQLPKKTALLARRMHSGCDTLLAYVVFKAGTSKASEVHEASIGNSARENRSGDDHDADQNDNISVMDPLRSVRESCAALNLTIFHGKHLRVNPAEHTRGPLRQSVFLGNLPFDVTEEEVILLFQEPARIAGSNLVGVRVNRDKETGLGVGIGFASFDDELGVRAALNMRGELQIRGRVLRMERASKLKKRNTKTAKRIAKKDAKLAERKSGNPTDVARSEKRKKQRERKKSAKRGELAPSRKIRKERRNQKMKVKIKHAARKERQAQAGDGVAV